MRSSSRYPVTEENCVIACNEFIEVECISHSGLLVVSLDLVGACMNDIVHDSICVNRGSVLKAVTTCMCFTIHRLRQILTVYEV